jgi:hypothetical protein
MASLKELQEQLDDQQEVIDQVSEILESAYTPEASRGDMVEAISEALDVLSGEADESDDDPDDDNDE